jgi:hypothetical protein
MSKLPTLTAFVVEEPKAGSNKKSYFREVGAAWPHKSGTGFDLIIPSGISVTGRIVLLPPKTAAAPSADA